MTTTIWPKLVPDKLDTVDDVFKKWVTALPKETNSLLEGYVTSSQGPGIKTSYGLLVAPKPGIVYRLFEAEQTNNNNPFPVNLKCFGINNDKKDDIDFVLSSKTITKDDISNASALEKAMTDAMKTTEMQTAFQRLWNIASKYKAEKELE